MSFEIEVRWGYSALLSVFEIKNLIAGLFVFNFKEFNKQAFIADSLKRHIGGWDEEKATEAVKC